MMTPPDFPVGPYVPVESLSPEQRETRLLELANLPRQLPMLVAGAPAALLDAKYRNWTVRQIAHHLVDSHTHGFLRTKWALSEDRPVIKPYDEGRWVEFVDARGDLQPSLLMLTGLHIRWVALLRSLSPDDWSRSYFHPESQRFVSLDQLLDNYAWHGRHHLAQIQWLKNAAVRA